MNKGAIWWGQIGNSLRLLTHVTNTLRDCRSAVLQVPRELPWRQEFYQQVDVRRSAFGGERRLMRLDWEAGAEPGDFVLKELCSSETQANYWPGQSQAAYLGGLEEILLNDYYVWICDLRSKADLAKWVEFIAQYEQASQNRRNRAVFILEYQGNTVEAGTLEHLSYTVEDYDCRVFCLETAAELGNTELREYQAELALCIGGNDPELCGALLASGNQLLREPIKTAQTVIQEARTSEGLPFAPQQEQQLESSVWKAAIVLLFPMLEEYRLNFIARYKFALTKHLPISNSNGERITDPYDLEIGAIKYITDASADDFPGMDADAIRLCKKARNLLAHIDMLSYEDIKHIIALQ